MSIHLEVAPHQDDGEISFGDIQIRHRACDHSVTTVRRNPATGAHSLRCNCGLEIQFHESGGVETEIVYSAIDRQSRTIPENLYSANRAGALVVSGPMDNGA